MMNHIGHQAEIVIVALVALLKALEWANPPMWITIFAAAGIGFMIGKATNHILTRARPGHGG